MRTVATDTQTDDAPADASAAVEGRAVRSEARVVITNPTGLHARPAVKLAQLAAGFDADVEIRADETGEWVRARSTARVMKLKAGARSTIHFRAEGAQADDALSALVDFVRRDFDEGPAAAAPETVERPGEGAGVNEGPGESGTTVDEPLPEGRTVSAVVASPGLAIGVLHLPPGARKPGRGAGGSIREVGGLVVEAGGQVGETGGLPREAGGSARELGGSAREADGRDRETGGVAREAGGLGRKTGSPAPEAGGLAPEADDSSREAGRPERVADGPVRGVGDPAPEAADPNTGRVSLDEAVARSLADLRGLARGAGELAAGVIGFQISLLEDEEFLEPARAEIEAGVAAGQAWVRHLAEEIRDCESAPTGYLRDRAADLRDLRDRVAAALGGDTLRGDLPGHGLPGHDPPEYDLPGHGPSSQDLPERSLAGHGWSRHGPPGHGRPGRGLPDRDPPGQRSPSHVLTSDHSSRRDLANQPIVIVDELTPSHFLEIDWSRAAGAATYSGSPASHVAMLARAQGVPMLVQLACDSNALAEGTEAILDAEGGRLVLDPPPPVRERYARRAGEQRARERETLRHVSRPARTREGSRVRVLLNVDAPACLGRLDPSHCDGIGLTRTEFLFHGAEALPGEDVQLRFYRRLLAWAQGRPVTVRTLDAGGDKLIPGLTPAGESNPFLGLRGVRLSLARPEVLATQLRALARAGASGELKVMLPMVAVPGELDEVRRLLAGEVEALRAAGIEAAAPRLGMMVEVPAAALTIETFDADFFSIGTNDLTQYVLAAGRDSTSVADLLDPLHPAVLELIARVAGHGARTGREVSVCGEMAARTEGLRALLEAGIRAFSVPPAVLASVKAALATL